MVLLELKKIIKAEYRDININKFRELAKRFLGNPKHKKLSKDVVSFIKSINKAEYLEKQKVATTYLILNNKKSLLLGFFTINLKNLNVSKTNLSSSSMKKIIGSSYDKNDKHTQQVQSILIA